LKWLRVLDEYTREDLALEVGRRRRAEEVIEALVDLFALRGVSKPLGRSHVTQTGLS